MVKRRKGRKGKAAPKAALGSGSALGEAKEKRGGKQKQGNRGKEEKGRKCGKGENKKRKAVTDGNDANDIASAASSVEVRWKPVKPPIGGKKPQKPLGLKPRLKPLMKAQSKLKAQSKQQQDPPVPVIGSTTGWFA